jgi:predicted O-methyltransferase YrrM
MTALSFTAAEAAQRIPLPSTVAALEELLGGSAYLTDEEVMALRRYAERARHTVVEIGAAFGASTSLLVSSVPDGTRVHSLDPFVIDSMGTWSASEATCRANVSRFLHTVTLGARLSRWTLDPRASYEAAPAWDKPIGLLFIDGDHTYEAVRRDFEDWVGHVVVGGHILIHDSRKLFGTPAAEFNRGWIGPTQLVDELVEDDRVELIDGAHSLTIWRKV